MIEKTLNKKRFGQLLTQAVKRIALYEDKPISVVQDEIGYSLRKKNGDRYEGRAIVEHWRKGNLPPNLTITVALTKALGEKKGLEAKECEAFLNHAGHPDPASACREIFTQSSSKQQASILPTDLQEQAELVEQASNPSMTVNISFNRGMLFLTVIVVLAIVIFGVYFGRSRLVDATASEVNPFLLDAVYVEEGPEINGRLDDLVWDKAQPILFARHPEINGKTTAIVKLLWDEKYLYVGVDVNDTQIEGAGETPWDSDSISVAVENGDQLIEYRHSLSDAVDADRAGDALSEHWFKTGSSFNDPTDSDDGYQIEMRIPMVIAPVENDIVSIDLLSVDHDKNPNAPYNSSKTIFSKVFWDGDNMINEANGFLRFIRE